MATKKWIDENGIEIPAKRVTPAEKLKEQKLDKLTAKAKRINKLLADFKKEFSEDVDEIIAAVMSENNVEAKETKGNMAIFNFDRSVKAEVDVNERIEFDDTLIAVAKSHMDEFLTMNTNGLDNMIRELILDAFSTSRGKLDSKKVTGLTKYRQRIDAEKYPAFHLMLDAIEKAIRRPSSKRYFRVSVADADGKYNVIDLNFSSI
jgi:ribosomal protein S18